MLQRIQTLWISFAIIAAVLSFEFPFAIATSRQGFEDSNRLDAGSSVLLIFLTLLSVVVSGATILSFANLKRQKKFCWLGILVGVLLSMVYLSDWKDMSNGDLVLTSLIPICIPFCLWLAWLGISKDLKMIRKIGRTRKS